MVFQFYPFFLNMDHDEWYLYHNVSCLFESMILVQPKWSMNNWIILTL